MANFCKIKSVAEGDTSNPHGFIAGLLRWDPDAVLWKNSRSLESFE